MKRMHIHIGVNDLDTSIEFYSAVFGQQPTVRKHDYAKWEVDDPSVNLAISLRTDNEAGIDHIGIQAGSGTELEDLHDRLARASVATLHQEGAKCCYAESDKHWAIDPSGVAWEMFHTMREVAVYGDDRARELRDVAER